MFPAVRQGSWVSTDEPGKVPVAVATVVQAALASCTATAELAEDAAAPGSRATMVGTAPSLSNGYPHSQKLTDLADRSNARLCLEMTHARRESDGSATEWRRPSVGTHELVTDRSTSIHHCWSVVRFTREQPREADSRSRPDGSRLRGPGIPEAPAAIPQAPLRSTGCPVDPQANGRDVSRRRPATSRQISVSNASASHRG